MGRWGVVENALKLGRRPVVATTPMAAASEIGVVNEPGSTISVEASFWRTKAACSSFVSLIV
jgi:hypothetical protein